MIYSRRGIWSDLPEKLLFQTRDLPVLTTTSWALGMRAPHQAKTRVVALATFVPPSRRVLPMGRKHPIILPTATSNIPSPLSLFFFLSLSLSRSPEGQKKKKSTAGLRGTFHCAEAPESKRPFIMLTCPHFLLFRHRHMCFQIND